MLDLGLDPEGGSRTWSTPSLFLTNCLRALGSAFPNQVFPVRTHSQAGHLPHPLIHVIRVCEDLRKALLVAFAGVGVKPAQAAAAASAPAGGVSRSSTKVVHQFLEKVTIAFLMDNVGNVCCRETKVFTVPGYSTP